MSKDLAKYRAHFFSLSVYLCIIFFSFGGTGVGTQDFVLAKQVLCSLNHTSCPFFSGYFGDGVSLLAQAASNLNPPNLNLPQS
jgi:hypothetical protein